MPYHFSHWSSIQPSPPSLPESILCVRRASTARRGAGWEGARLESEGRREERRSEQEESRRKGRRGTAHPGRWARTPLCSMAAAARLEGREMDGAIVLKLWSWSCQNGVVLYNLARSACIWFTMPQQNTAWVSRSYHATGSPSKEKKEKKRKHHYKRKRPSLASSQQNSVSLNYSWVPLIIQVFLSSHFFSFQLSTVFFSPLVNHLFRASQIMSIDLEN